MRDDGSIGTFDLDDGLPRLPVPPLAETCARYLLTIEPLVDVPTYRDVTAAAAELQTHGGRGGAALQAAIEERARRLDNWLSEWWEDGGILEQRSPLPVHSSTALAAEAMRATGDQAVCAGEATANALGFYLEILDETLPPESNRRGVPLDMGQYRRLFATNRMPGLERDRIATFDTRMARHIVVSRNGHFFKMRVLDEDLRPLGLADMIVQFRTIIERSDALGPGPAVAALTALGRESWVHARERLAIDVRNRKSLDAIERALFHVALDGGSFRDPAERARADVHGARGQRWFDKSLTLVVDAEGRVALHGEQSPVDLAVRCSLLDAVLKPVMRDEPRSRRYLPPPERLVWVTGGQFGETIEEAVAHQKSLADDLDLEIVSIPEFGRNLLEGFGCGAGALVQMVLQLAYWRRHRRIPKSFETVSTRTCRRGRTEALRVASRQSKIFVFACDNPKVTIDHKRHLLREACLEHTRRAREASRGQGVDRHMFGLERAARSLGMTELPRLFDLEIHRRGFELATVQLPSPVIQVCHTPPATADGYGVSYAVKDNSLTFTVSSFHSSPTTDSRGLVTGIKTAARDIRECLRQDLSV